MFTKLNRVLLASGLAVASAALLSPSAFAAPGTTASSGTVTVTGNVQPYTNIVVTPGPDNTFAVDFNVAVVDKAVAAVDYTTNVQGVWTINAVGGNAGKEGQLVSADTTATIPYTLKLGSGAAVTPGTAATAAGTNTLATGTLTNTIVEVAGASLTASITAANTKVPTAPTSAYAETVTLVFTSDQ
jgi:hypothetical protein